jgi:hypothetical protein
VPDQKPGTARRARNPTVGQVVTGAEGVSCQAMSGGVS